MTKRTRKLVGTGLILIFVVFYAFIGMAVAQLPVVQDAPAYVHGLFYVIVGLGWVLPIMPLISWMEKGGRNQKT